MSDHWFPLDDSLRARVPDALWSWIAETGSLTQRMKRACRDFSLVVLAEDETLLEVDDAATMGIEVGAPARCRVVHLCCRGEPWIRARSLLPHSTLIGAGRPLAALGDRPLGDALFAHPDMVRGPIEVTDTPSWGRRSVFRLAGEPVLVAEWFLPALPACTR